MKFKQVLRWSGRYVALPLVLILGGAGAATYLILSGARASNDNSNWFGTPNGIDVRDYVSLGGFDQYIRIRGRDRTHPVLLDLHGGPGGAQSGMSHRSLRPLAEYFVLVEWDQRGAGKSVGDESLVPTMSYQRMVEDAIELIEHLCDRLDKDKVIVVGHSWGSMLGIGIVKARPDLIAAYVGVGQGLGWNLGFDETQRLLMEAATSSGDEETLQSLSALPDHWPPADDFEANFERIKTIQKPLVKYGGGIHAAKYTNPMKSDIVLDALTSPDAKLSELVSMLNPGAATQALIKDLYGRDLRQELGYVFAAPMFVFQGEHDWQTATTLVKPWFNQLEAPYKAYVTFEDSAHIVISEEPGKFLYELVTQVRPMALESTP